MFVRPSAFEPPLDQSGRAHSVRSNGALDYVTLSLDTANGTLSVGDRVNPEWKCNFVYQRTGEQRLNLQGAINGNSVSLKLYRSHQPSRLMSRAFH